MFIRKGLKVFTNCKFCIEARFSTLLNNNADFKLNSKFSHEEREKILNTLNNCDADQLSRFNVTQARIKNLEKWKIKEGPFRSLTDLLEVDGLGVKVLERLCESIVTETPVNKTNGLTKTRRQYLTPMLSNEQNLTSAVGFHLGSNGISWAKLCTVGNKLEDWNYIDFTANLRKILPLETFKLAMQILNEIPIADAYIFEAPAGMAPQSNKQASIITSYNQQLELISMLFALINTSAKHNRHLSNDLDASNTVYHLRANLSARLFKTLMGSERVSSTTSVLNILQCDVENLPCSIVNVDKSLKQQYFMQSPVVRELLGQALLLIIAFMDLCVNKNPRSVMAVMPGRR